VNLIIQDCLEKGSETMINKNLEPQKEKPRIRLTERIAEAKGGNADEYLEKYKNDTLTHNMIDFILEMYNNLVSEHNDVLDNIGKLRERIKEIKDHLEKTIIPEDPEARRVQELEQTQEYKDLDRRRMTALLANEYEIFNKLSDEIKRRFPEIDKYRQRLVEKARKELG
jgi:hypothetical protein